MKSWSFLNFQEIFLIYYLLICQNNIKSLIIAEMKIECFTNWISRRDYFKIRWKIFCIWLILHIINTRQILWQILCETYIVKLILRHMHMNLCFMQNVARCERALLITSSLLRNVTKKNVKKITFPHEFVTLK